MKKDVATTDVLLVIIWGAVGISSGMMGDIIAAALCINLLVSVYIQVLDRWVSTLQKEAIRLLRMQNHILRKNQ